MIDERCFGSDVDRSKISPDAKITGATYITGSRTRIAAGAVVQSSRLHDAIVESGAAVIDTILVTEGHAHSHNCDSAGRTVVRSAEQSEVASGATVTGCTLINTSIGAGSGVVDTWMQDCRIGENCTIRDAKLIITNTASHVTVIGPTEVSEAFLGDHTTIDKRGYLEGIFSNKFHQLRFDEQAGKLKVVGTIDLPHVSMYGANSINSTNSGKLLPQPDGILKGFGRPAGLWRDHLLSHEQIELAPCCFVLPWTKVVGQSAMLHHSDDDLVNDDLTTYLMPFSLSGWQGDLTRGLVMPGELSVGYGPKQRKGGWVFTYAVDAVIAMVQRLHDALDADKKHVADTIVTEAIKTAMEMTLAMAHKNSVDLSIPHEKQRAGFPKWIGLTHAILQAHIDGQLWEFRDGQPLGWRKDGGKWTHPNIAGLLAVAPDAIENQKSLAELFAFEDPVPPLKVAMPSWVLHHGRLPGDEIGPDIADNAKVAEDAFVGPGCRIGSNTVVESGAFIWNSELDNCIIRRNARVERSIVNHGSVGPATVVRSSYLTGSHTGGQSNIQCASVACSELVDHTTVSPLADLSLVNSNYSMIIGGRFHTVNADVYLMSMHLAGGCENMTAVPVVVRVGDKDVEVPAIPMLGGGSLIRGLANDPVKMQCCFVGSNAIIEADTYIGLGCFILGRLGPHAGLLPFTFSFDENLAHHQIGAVLTSLASTVITHFVAWTFNACGAEMAPAVAGMIRAGLDEGIAAIKYEQARRAGTADASAGSEFEKFLSLPQYSDDQLKTGLSNYQKAIDSGAWDMEFRNGELVFTSDKGHWQERNGSALWKPNP